MEINMSFFEIVGMIVTGIVALAVAAFIIILIINFIGYQKGARLTRDYGYSGPDRSEWFWTVYGAKTWLSSFRRGGNWYREVGDPEDDNVTLRIYENGKLERKAAWYGA